MPAFSTNRVWHGSGKYIICTRTCSFIHLCVRLLTRKLDFLMEIYTNILLNSIVGVRNGHSRN